MRCVVISDVHGNLQALESFLKELPALAADFVICLGDILDPFKESKDVYLALKSHKIPVLRGNHEDYTVEFHRAADKSEWWLPTKRSIALVAEWMGPELARELEALPFSHTLAGPDRQDVYFCHASPLSNALSYYDRWNPEMERAIAARPESVIVAGHKHVCFEKTYAEKKLFVAGSLGIPQSGLPRPQFFVLDFKNGQWDFEWKSLTYDPLKTVRAYKDSGWLKKGAPFSWLLADEIISAQKRVGPFLRSLHTTQARLKTEDDWMEFVKQFLTARDRWTDLEEFLLG